MFTENKNLIKSYLETISIVSNASKQVFFCKKQFQRKYCQFFKIQNANKDVFYISAKFIKCTLRIHIQGNNYFFISKFNHGFTYFFYAKSSKELIQKILKHHLIS